MKLEDLARKCWGRFDELKNYSSTKKYVVDTMPILYFGDYEAYQRSDIKIITAALNPSDMEFKHAKDDTCLDFFRFSKAEGLRGKTQDQLTDADMQIYLESLNDYFKKKDVGTNRKRGGNSYEWFDNKPKQNLLSPFNASYYQDEGVNRVLHTDFISTIPTDPTISKITGTEKGTFAAEGIPAWFNLLEILQPDIVFMSVGKGNLSHFAEEFMEYKTLDDGKKKAKRLDYIPSYELESGKKVIIFNEKTPNQKPFVGLGNEFTKTLGQEIYIKYMAGGFNNA